MNKLRIINKRGRFYPQSETFFIWNSFFDEKTLDEIYFSILSEAERWIDYYLYRWGIDYSVVREYNLSDKTDFRLKPDKSVEAPEYDLITEGFDPNKLKNYVR